MDLTVRSPPGSVDESSITQPRRDFHAVNRPINRINLRRTKHTGVFKFSGCLKTDPKLENNSFRAPETMNCTFWQEFRGAGNGGSSLSTLLPAANAGNQSIGRTKDGASAKHLGLHKTPDVDPALEAKHEKIVSELRHILPIDAVQFGVFYRPKYPSNDKEPLSPLAFSIEWEHTTDSENSGSLTFEYDHKLIRLKLINPVNGKIESSIAISFGSIQRIDVGYDYGKPYICFNTLIPPVLEETNSYRSLTGKNGIDNRKFKRRIGYLHLGHKRVAPYAQKLRVVLYHPTIDMIDQFVDMCKITGLGTRCKRSFVETFRCDFFSAKQLDWLGGVFRELPWPVAFQLESLLHNGVLPTGEVKDLIQPVRTLCKTHKAICVGDFLRRVNTALPARPDRESPFKCFERIRRDFEFAKPTSSQNTFRCCHVTFTPTRMILEGPYATQSNRVLRRYREYEDHFIRVDFRDEDRLQYRWDREVDGTSFLKQRVGGILKDGFELAGRRFEFLAYSSSALREHAVWFVNPFHGLTAGNIRNSLGSFEGTSLKKCPSLYAARLAQAFTATDTSVQILNDQWEVVDDLGTAPYLFTDGVGTISKDLGDKIWSALCEARRIQGQNFVQPSAYQIRFLGFKGVVGVDERLAGTRIMMRLRGSMKKFESSQGATADIEIAQSFERPKTCHLNKPLVMILEDLGVKIEAFTDLQEQAVADARTIDDSYDQFRNILESHGLGRPYRLAHILKRIGELGLGLNPSGPSFDTPFLRQVRQVSMNDVLRDIKHSARIPIPESYHLVGVADEGPAYEKAGYTDVYKLKEGNIFACIQTSKDSEPIWLEGACSISRSPVAHPGDVQRVHAIGKPPEGMLCLFAHMKNVVVLPSVGKRSLASCLGGGDVDGDIFLVIQYKPLLPSKTEYPAEYLAGETRKLEKEVTVEDICDFVVEYINSDVLGLLSDRLLVIADQSEEGTFDKKCLYLAELCSQAVDYPKKGIPVNIDGNRLPRPRIRCKPDWHAAEVADFRETDYYPSVRALGVMYRSIQLDSLDGQPLSPNNTSQQPLTDSFFLKLSDHILPTLQPNAEPEPHRLSEIAKIFGRYVDELRYICATHTLSNTVRLREAEVVAGTILAKCSQKRWRNDRIYRMSFHASTLATDIQRELAKDLTTASRDHLVAGLTNAWYSWVYSLRHNTEFGANSFGLIALGVIFDCLEKLPQV